MDLKTTGTDIERVIVTEAEIRARLKELAVQVEKDYEGRDLLLIGVLKGAVMTMADFARSLQRHIEMDWMAVSSYGSGTKSSGVVRILKDLDRDITGREVVIVEDIVDTGNTLHQFLPQIRQQQPASLKIAALLHKPAALKYPIAIDYLGFTVPDKFLLGFGLDLDGLGRNLPAIYQLVEG